MGFADINGADAEFVVVSVEKIQYSQFVLMELQRNINFSAIFLVCGRQSFVSDKCHLGRDYYIWYDFVVKKMK